MSCVAWTPDISTIRESTYVPSDDHAHEIQRRLAGALPDQLKIIQGEISQVQAMLHNLLHQRDLLLNVVDVHQASVSTARRLPTEILVEIFRHLEERGSNGRMQLVSSSQLRRLDMMTVCKRWNDTIRATPTLWTNVFISNRCPPSSVRELLSFSNTLPITLIFDGNPEETSDGLWKALASSSGRWRCAKLRMTYRAMKILSDALAAVPLLEELDLHCVGGRIQGDHGAIDVFEHAERLRVVSIAHHDHLTFGESYSSDIRLPWSQLLSLRCKGRFHLTSVATSSLSQLERFLYLPDAPFHYLDSLTLPSLKSLSVGQYNYPALIDLIQRSECSLTTLVASHPWIRSHLFTLLDLSPEVVELHVSLDTFSSYTQLWEYLSLSRNLPRLRKLVVSLSETTLTLPTNFAVGQFLSMIKARAETATAGRTIDDAHCFRVEMNNMPHYPPAVQDMEVGLCALSVNSSFNYRQ